MPNLNTPSPSQIASEGPYAWIESALETIHQANWYRSPQVLSGQPGAVMQLNGQPVVNFASNDYLGFAAEPSLKAAAIAAIQDLGTGSTGSRLLSGHRQLHQDLEQAIADLKQAAAALVFSSGYAANLGTITALVGKRDLIVADAYNHSSLKNGAILSGAHCQEYPHLDLEYLQDYLQTHRQNYRRCLILTDTVFSMDGDLCPLPDLLEIGQQFKAMVMVDEAHATGVLGARGAGGVEYFGCMGVPLIQMGTLSKALGSLGGYVAGSAALIDFLRNRSPSWIYTTGLTPADTAAALQAIHLVYSQPQRRQQLWQNVTLLRDSLARLPQLQASPSLRLLPSQSAIVCLQLPSPASALALSQSLRQAGFWVPAIRPPTVPTSRLRFSLMASHQPEQIQACVAALAELLEAELLKARPLE
jgi:8-amino-7-oxononanoate synthase